jgi:type II secretory pathway pseudopilin PulG
MSRRRGFSIAEMLVYMAVLSVFTSAVYGVFGLSGRFYRASEARSDSLQEALRAASSVNRLLAGGATNTLQVDPASSAMMFLSSQPVGGGSFRVNTTTGDLRWQKWVCIYLNRSQKRLMTSFQEIAPVNNAELKPTVIPASPGFAPLLGSASRRLLARNISDLQLSLVDARTVRYEITTSVEPDVTTNKTQRAALGVTTTGYFTLRN